jgi:hypothetical protein
VQTETLHPFEASGLGVGPFRLLYVASFPSPSMAEQNPEAYNNALRALPREVPLGICNHCGMALMHNFVCQSTDGKKFVVGADCAHKLGDMSLGNKVKIEVLRRQRADRRAKVEAQRAARRAKWLIDNADKIKAQEAARVLMAEQAKVAAEAVTAKWAFVLPVLDAQNGNFCASMAQGIREGNPPRGRAVDIIGSIYAKSHGRSGSKAYTTAITEFESKIEPDGDFI